MELILEKKRKANSAWRDAVALTNKEQKVAKCKEGWKAFGEALHTQQDMFAHTDKDYLPLTSFEHGGSFGDELVSKIPVPPVLAWVALGWLARDVWNSERKEQAIRNSQWHFERARDLADPKSDECNNCIVKPK